MEIPGRGRSVLRGFVLASALLVAGWMAFDGGYALATGDYVTPRSGPHAGQLGGWSRVVEAAGIPARSTAMKAAFLVYGSVWLAVILVWLVELRWSWWAMLLLAAGSLWYLPFGTLLGAAQVVLLLILRAAPGDPDA